MFICQHAGIQCQTILGIEAKSTGEPRLFKGDDFRKTDLQPALL
jgi:uncharacterized protein with PIN domain